jgi:hypothetical protein
MVRSGTIALVAAILLSLAPLAPLANLAAPPAHAAGSATLVWTAPGDDGTSGQATRYDIRYSVVAITEANFFGAWQVPNIPPPAPAGWRQSVTVENLIENATYFFALKAVDDRGNWSPMSNVAVVTGAGLPAALREETSVLSLSAPAPNPARSLTRLALELPRPAHVWVEVLDLLGRRVRTLVDGARPAGHTELAWALDDDASRPLPAGVYLVRARALGEVFLRRLAVVR